MCDVFQTKEAAIEASISHSSGIQPPSKAFTQNTGIEHFILTEEKRLLTNSVRFRTVFAYHRLLSVH